MNAPEKLIGSPVRRKEDYRFLTGNGQYTDDVVLPHQSYGYFLRSPHAHARIKSIDTSEAAASPGVIAVLTGDDMAADKVGGLPCGWLIHSIDGSPMKEPPHPSLAHGKVRHVGDQVALVVAESLQQARDASEKIVVDYEELPAVIGLTDASSAASLVHDDVPANTCYTWGHGDKAATDAAFAKAAHVTTLQIVNNRLIPNAIEPRAVNASYTRQDDGYTVYVANQNPHVERLLMGAFVLGLPESRLRIIAPDVGGGFGSKIFLYPEDVALTWASKKVGRPIKWTAERSESFLTDAHGRDHVTKAELALDADGNFLAMRVHTIANMGAYLSTFASSVPTILYATLLAGQYATPAIYAEVHAVFTNTSPVDAYRGAGRPEATYVVERLVEAAARETNVDPATLRRKNFIRTFPYATPVGLTYDTGDYEPCLARAEELADVAGFPARRAEAKQRGKLRGLGYSCYIEACGLAPSNIAGALGARAGLFEVGEIRVHPTGTVTVFTGSHSHGQGHETTFAQIVADRLGIALDAVEIVHGDTGRVPFGMGTYGSRSLAVGGSAIMKALDKIEAKAKKIAAHLLEASDADIEFKDGVFRVAGTDRTKTFGEVALTAYVPHNYPLDKLEPGLNENAFYDPTNFTYPSGAYICEVEVDPDTGESHVVKFTAVDDFGNVINPMIVEGQVHGGIGQGLGQAMLEQCVYDPESGQLLTGSYMDYAMPRAGDLPDFTVETSAGTPCTHNPLGVKGCGEAGAIGSPPAFINAMVDALSPLGVHDLQMPATPHRVWQAIQSAQSGTA
ncbi:MAG: carbon monoxide dehydrogenase [Burkholderiaceae bacterium]|jgi:aerobic carbon-monoxide dehydrogenase large subunit|uniref:Xanthine dehydrogenase family protein molybdopterin-binding subunit n=1 Tax=Cupriavidus metallidurans TaxID=119219 RepID=A0A132HIR1_9BURK|nr:MULTISPECIES: xanthine dehydrogenase family protein molybdopterin-binding subunit [Cupriavidus]PCH56099.1 MAG: carbon monoxide dehydrogenase [Burkholderiaceae bacterium]KWR83622.1 carbon monoxide dehydrogenase [Cupriavidus sp. SHE]KWW36011.1 Carbon monoxide dehydrogenase large chain [Cupriavidus metallidurans]QBP08565.1 xanthine dehydrogenase family protein molybdopterin-binding subunit [Cupriavidus metallidurans]QWC88989.1 xanthine dehydrogenase family protein molybdopterin-binding subunit